MSRRRPGLTILDLVVALGMLTILAGLLLPALQLGRGAAARTASLNNLKVLGLASHNYHDANGRLPAGCDENNYSALAHLLPYVEQDALYRQIQFKMPLEQAPEAVRKARVKIYVSPRDTVETAMDKSAPTNYVFNAGSAPGLKDNNGMFSLNSKVSFRDVTDGLSNTVLAAETLKGDGGTKPVTVQRQHVRLKAADLAKAKEDAGAAEWKAGQSVVGDRCASWLDGRFLQTTFTATLALNDPKPDVDFGGAGGYSAVRSPDDQVLILLGDGSTRPLSAKFALKTWQSACNRKDGQAVNFDK